MVWRRRVFDSFRVFCYRVYQHARSQEYARYILRKYKLNTPTAILALTGFTYKETSDLSDETITQELNSVDNVGKTKKLEDGWELVTESKDYQVLRRIHSGSIYEYRCSGSYHDITARGFIEAQCDLDFRKTWDSNVVSLEVLECNPYNETETVKWVAKYPYPMSARVYYYVRRKKVDKDHQKIVVLSHVLDEKEYPTESDAKKYVRVTTYRSNMVVKAHKGLDESGFDYVLTYYDDPKASIPMPAYYWIVSHGGPTYLKTVHDAAIKWQTAEASRKVFKHSEVAMVDEETQTSDPEVFFEKSTQKSEKLVEIIEGVVEKTEGLVEKIAAKSEELAEKIAAKIEVVLSPETPEKPVEIEPTEAQIRPEVEESQPKKQPPPLEVVKPRILEESGSKKIRDTELSEMIREFLSKSS